MENKDQEFTIEEYAERYIKLKQEEALLKKELEAVNKRLKQLMKEQDQTEAHCSNGVVKYVVQHRSEFNEERAISILKESGNVDCIGLKEYVDMDILEKKLYNEAIDSDVVKKLDTCRKPKDVPTLTITKG